MHKVNEQEQEDIWCRGRTHVGVDVGDAAIVAHVVIETADIGEEALVEKEVIDVRDEEEASSRAERFPLRKTKGQKMKRTYSYSFSTQENKYTHIYFPLRQNALAPA
jgi:hypothetical protein